MGVRRGCLAAACALSLLAGLAPVVITGPASAVTERSVDRQWPVDEKGDGCAPPVWPKAKKSQDYRRVLVVGDSLIRHSRAILEADLTEAGWIPTVRCWGAKGSVWGVQQIERARALGQLPKTIVVSLGTNDIWWLNVPMDVAIDSMMASIGPHHTVFWVNLWFGPHGYDRLPKPFAANRTLRAKAEEYPNLRVVNFARAFVDAELAGEGVGWEDGVHLNAAGNRLRVRTIVGAMGVPVRPAPTPTT